MAKRTPKKPQLPATRSAPETIVARPAEPKGGGTFGTGATWSTFFNTFSPEAFGLQVAAKQSTSQAHRLVFIRDPHLYDLYDEMVDRDPTVGAAINHIVGYILGLEIRFEPADESERAAEIASAARIDLTGPKCDTGFNALVEWMARGSINHGLAVAETMWRYDTERRRTVPDRYVARHPGQFAFDPDGRIMLWRGFDQKERPADNDEFDPMPLKFVVAKYPGLYGSPYGRAPIHPLRWLWSFKRTIILQYVSALDKYGTPIAKVTVDDGSEAGPDSSTNSQMAAAQTMLKTLTRDSGVVLPKGMTLDFESRGATAGSMPHRDAIQWIDNSMIKLLLGATLQMQEAEFGTRAQGETHERSASQYNAPLPRHIEDALNGTLLAPWMMLNFGTMELAPRIVLDADDERDVDQTIKIVEAAARHGLRQSAAQAREWLGIKAAEEGEEAVEDGEDAAGGGEPGGFFGRLQKKKNALRFADARPDLKAARRAIRRNEKIAARLAELTRPAIADALEALRLALSDYGPDAPLQRNMAGAHITTPAIPDQPVELALLGIRALAAADSWRQIRRQIDFEDEPEGNEGIYREGLDWLEANGAASASERRFIAEAIRRIDPQYDSRIAREAIKGSARKISRDIAVETTVELERHMIAAVERGTTIADFLKQMDGLAADGKMPGRIDPYLENVFRTETATAYNRMTREAAQSSEAQDFFWGFELFNPDDDRSRPSHAAVNGLRVRKGSEAYAALPTPPWSYSCRCAILPLYSGDPAASDFEEPSNALDLIQSIERFDQ